MDKLKRYGLILTVLTLVACGDDSATYRMGTSKQEQAYREFLKKAGDSMIAAIAESSLTLSAMRTHAPQSAQQHQIEFQFLCDKVTRKIMHP